VVERDLVDRRAIGAEGVKIGVALRPPIAEFDAELERRLGFPNEVVLVDAQKRVEGADRWNGGFADADGSDLRRSDGFW